MKVVDAIRHTKGEGLYVAVAFMFNRPADGPWVMSPRKKDGLTIADVEECMYNKVKGFELLQNNGKLCMVYLI